MKIQLTIEKFQEILTKGYTLDHIYVLKVIEEGFDIASVMGDSPKIAVIHQSLVRKGLLFETKDKLTTIGKELLIFVDTKDRKRIIKPKVESTEFNQWWDNYPKGDTFEYRGRKFEGDRTLRVKEDDCRTKFNKIVIDGEVTAIELIDALKLHVFKMKEMSFKTNANRLKFMQNSFTYLNQCSYDSFVDEIRKGVKIEETKSTGATDI